MLANEIQEQMMDAVLSAKIASIAYSIRAPALSFKDTNTSSRKLNYYRKEDLLLGNAELKEKVRFSGAQILWISIVKDLLQVGIPAAIISKLKNDCQAYKLSHPSTFESITQLELIASLIVEQKSDIRLIVMPEGSYTFINFSIASNLYKESYYLSNAHVSIPLFEKVRVVWQKVSGLLIEKKKVIFEEVNGEEQIVLDALRSAKGEVEEVVITLRNQELPQAIMINQTFDPKAIGPLCKFLRDCKNCKVEIAYGATSGEPIHVRKKNKKKLPNLG